MAQILREREGGRKGGVAKRARDRPTDKVTVNFI